MPNDANPADLKAENEQLKQQLQEYRDLQEELMAQRVFKKTRKLLVIYVTIGGLLLLASGVVGVTQVVSYAQNHAQKTIDDLVENQSKKALLDEAEKQKQTLQAITDKMQADLAKLADEQAAKIRAIGQPIGMSTTGQPIRVAMLPKGANESPGVLDYTSEMGAVRDAGNEGCSVGFAVAAALEFQIKKSSGKTVVISPRYIYNESRMLEGTIDQDSGTSLRDAIKVLRLDGAVAEDAWPYKAGEFRMKPPKDLAKAQHYKITQSQPVHNTLEMKAALQRIGPVPGGFVMYESAAAPATQKNGVLPLPKANERIKGGHAVCFVGFDDGAKLLKFRNQWGAKWGDKGYGYLSYEYADKFLSDATAISMEAPVQP